MAHQAHKSTPLAAPRALRRVLWQARLIIWAERMMLAFWPFVTLCVMGLGAVVWHVPDYVTGWLGLGALALYGCALLWVFVRGAWHFKPPTRNDLYQRLDHPLPGRPVGTHFDTLRLGANDPAANSLWQAHQMRNRASLQGVRRPSYHVRLSTYDPYALRLLALMALGLGLVFAPPALQTGISTPQASGTPIISGPRYELWLQPPDYTNLPTQYLTDFASGDVLSAPVNSDILLRSYDAENAITLRESVSQNGDTVIPDTADSFTEVTFAITRSGEISIADPAGVNRNWQIDVRPDQPPQISQNGPMTRTITGAMNLPFSASDDYGIKGGQLNITLDLDRVDRRYGLALTPEEQALPDIALPLPFVGDRRAFDGMFETDLAQHPWAGLPIIIDIQAVDDAGNVAQTQPSQEILAHKRFFDPIAKAIIDIRRQLLWNRDNAPRVHNLLRAITHIPEGFFDQERSYLMLRSAIRRLDYRDKDQKMPDADVQDLAELLWRAAQLQEDGDLANALERLRRAQQRLAEAMQNGATDAEIAQLMQELRNATRDYLRALAQNADPQEQPDAQANAGPSINSDQLQELMDRLQELMQQGRMAEAQELLRQLQQLLENIQVTQGQGQGEGDGQGGTQGQALQDLLQQQQDLADDTFQELQQQFDQPNQPGGAQRREDLARRQNELQQSLQNNADNGTDWQGNGDADQPLRDAQRGMQNAQDQIQQGELGQALGEQSKVLDNLRDGLRDLNQNGENRQGLLDEDGQELGTSDQQTDPLGRSMGQASDQFGRGLFNRKWPERGQDRLMYEELFEQLKNRAQDQTRPEFERDYLNRLLDRF